MELQDREKEFSIADIQVSLTTLEDVFLNIAKQAELETAAAEGRLVTLNLTSGASVEVSQIYFILPILRIMNCQDFDNFPDHFLK